MVATSLMLVSLLIPALGCAGTSPIDAAAREAIQRPILDKHGIGFFDALSQSPVDLDNVVDLIDHYR